MRLLLTRKWTTVAPILVGLATLAVPLLAEAADKKTKKDPLTTFAIYIMSGGEDLFGVAMTWLLILMSFIVVALLIKYAMDNSAARLMPAEAVVTYEQMLQEKRFREAIERAQAGDTAFDQVMAASLTEASNGYDAMVGALQEEAGRIAVRRCRTVDLLNIFGAIGPMVGLFGTVYGMIEAFRALANSGGQPNPADLASGILTALVTTFWGLIVGIPAVAGSTAIKNKIDAMMLEAVIHGSNLLRQFQPSAKKASASSSVPKPRPV